jgi:hypothetical protein
MSERGRLRFVLLLGAIGGAILAVTVTLLMDVFYAESLGGTWRDAIAMDMASLFSVSLSPDGFVVTVLFILIIAILALFGALLGAMFSTFVFRLLELLTRETPAR